MPEERDPRVLLAIERTFLAWTRTALALSGFGFVVARLGAFLEEGRGGGGATPGLQAAPEESLWVGIGLVLLGMVAQAFALLERRHLAGRYHRGEAIVPSAWSLSTFVGLALIGVGVVLLAYLLRLL